MKNAVGREIPDPLLEGGKVGFQGNDYLDGKIITRTAPTVKACVTPRDTKVIDSLEEAIKLTGLKDGMTVSFHHHFRNGDFIVKDVMTKIAEMGFKDITIACSSIGSASDIVAEHIEQGVVTGLQTSGIRGAIGEAVSHGKLKTPAIIRTHGGRVRAIEMGELKIDVAFIGASTSDNQGNASGKGGKSNCGGLGYSAADAKYASNVVVITDTIVDFPNTNLTSISGIDVDYVVVVDEIGDPKKIASAAARITDNPRDLKIAKSCVDIMTTTPYFKDGFIFQTGVGGPSIGTVLFLKEQMQARNITMGCAVAGISAPMVDLLKEGYIKTIADTQDFDVDAVDSLGVTPGHFEITTGEYANPINKGSYVNQLDFVILSALEVDTDFNVNVITGSDGVLRGAPGGHPDTSAGAKITMIVTPLVRGRMPTICESVVTVTTPGSTVDVVVTEYGVAVNPARKDIIGWLDDAGITHMTIEELKDKAYSIVGAPEALEWDDKIVAILEARDGTIMDVVRKVKGN